MEMQQNAAFISGKADDAQMRCSSTSCLSYLETKKRKMKVICERKIKHCLHKFISFLLL